MNYEETKPRPDSASTAAPQTRPMSAATDHPDLNNTNVDPLSQTKHSIAEGGGSGSDRYEDDFIASGSGSGHPAEVLS